MHPSRACWSGGTISKAFQLIFLICVLCARPFSASAASPTILGDLDADGQITVLDLVTLINHINGSATLAPELRGYADVNGDGYLNAADVDMLVDAILGVPITTKPKPLIAEPASGPSTVGVTVRPRVYFPKPI